MAVKILRGARYASDSDHLASQLDLVANQGIEARQQVGVDRSFPHTARAPPRHKLEHPAEEWVVERDLRFNETGVDQRSFLDERNVPVTDLDDLRTCRKRLFEPSRVETLLGLDEHRIGAAHLACDLIRWGRHGGASDGCTSGDQCDR